MTKKEQKNNLSIILEKDNNLSPVISKIVQDNYDLVSKFFPKIRPDKINIKILDSRRSFNQYIGRDTPEWMIGFTKKNTIHILSPKAIDQESSHQKNVFPQILAHEMVHIFISEINPRCLPWLEEGLALNLANQQKSPEIQKRNWQLFLREIFKNNFNLDRFASHEGYKISFWVVRALLNRFGVRRVSSLLKIECSDFQREKKFFEVLKISKTKLRTLIENDLHLG